MIVLMSTSTPNHPFVVWATCVLWITSIVSVAWAITLFYCVGDILILTCTDLVIAVVLLSGIIMIPTNCHMMYTIANGQKVDSKSKVLCCPLWICMLWIIAVNVLGVVLTIHRLYQNRAITANLLSKSLRNYRSVPKYKHFIDNIQWSLKCCGINSYADWFNHEWCEKPRDTEWNPMSNVRKLSKEQAPVSDSVPLSCCKSGSCISNYLIELGTQGIHTQGCRIKTCNIVLITMYIHLGLFIITIVAQVLILICISNSTKKSKTVQQVFNVRHLMPVNTNFDASSISSSVDLEEENLVMKAVRKD